MHKLLVSVLLCVACCSQAFAQTDSVSERAGQRVQKSYNIFFDISHSDIDTAFKTNARTLQQLKADVELTALHKVLPDTIYIHATASPDGAQLYNKWLAHQRAVSTKKLLTGIAPEFAQKTFIVSHSVEDWDGLLQVLLADENFPQRDQMLQILKDAKPNDDIHKALRGCTEGWDHFANNHIHALRNSSIGIKVLSASPRDEFYREGNYRRIYALENISSPMLKADVAPLVYAPEQGQGQWRKMIFALSTNLLMSGMSVGIEFPIKDNWSIGLDYFYPWILPKSNQWCLETLGGFVEAKYWFPGKKYQWDRTHRLQGHAVGVYGGLGYYDFQKNADGLQGEFVDMGVDYTFALPVAKGKLRMEFNIGVGLVRTWYRPYYMSSDYEDLIKEPGILYNTTNFFGPTKAGISLVVPIVVKTKAPRNLR